MVFQGESQDDSLPLTHTFSPRLVKKKKSCFLLYLKKKEANLAFQNKNFIQISKYKACFHYQNFKVI